MKTIHETPSGIDGKLLNKYDELFPDADFGTIEAPADMTAERLNAMLAKAIETGIPIDCEKEGWLNCPPSCFI